VTLNAIDRPLGRPALPLPPAALARILLDPLPPALLQPPCDFITAAIVRRHRSAFERLAPYAGRRIAVVPSDLPLAFMLTIDPVAPRLRPCRKTGIGRAEAEIRARLPVLIELLEGRIDGDALFFSRDLAISGDTELVVAMRNAIDDAEIDLVEAVAGALGPLAGAIRLLARAAGRVAGPAPGAAA